MGDVENVVAGIYFAVIVKSNKFVLLKILKIILSKEDGSIWSFGSNQAGY